MSKKFYTVRFQFPILWKLFFIIVIGILVLTFGFPGFRKAVYKLVPFKTAAVLLNSERIYDKSRSVCDVFTGDSGELYLLYKNKLLKKDAEGNKILLDSKRVSGLTGKYSSLKFGTVIDGNIIIGDWYGGVYRLSNDKWKRVYSVQEKKTYSTGLLKKDKHYYLFTSKGVHKLDAGFKLVDKQLEGEVIEDASYFNKSIYIRTRNGLYRLTSENWERVLEIYKDSRVFGLDSNSENLILFSREGLIYLNKNLEEIKKELPGNSFSDYTFNKDYEFISAYKKGIFIRKFNQEWVHFPSPALVKARSSKNHFHNGIVWAAFYTKGFYGIDVERLLELEGAK